MDNYRVTEQQVLFIQRDLEQRGIVLEDLKANLLDHICCILEEEWSEGFDFEKQYNKVIPRFFKEELRELQIETENVLKFKNFYDMVKIMKWSGIMTVILTTIGAILKTGHLPGAGVTILLGGLIFSLVFLPLLILIKFRDEEKKIDKVVLSFGLLLAIILSTGIIFKIMHWPYATNMLKWSTVAFTFIYVPVYFLTRVKRPEMRFNTIVNAVLMMACGGLFYSLFDLSYSRKFSEQMVENHVYLHEKSGTLLTSNDRIYATNQMNDDVIKFHNLRLTINNDIEHVAALITKDNSTKSVSHQLQGLQTNVVNYNAMLSSMSLSEMEKIKVEDITVINQLNTELAMNVLARVQMLLAVNENYYLTSQFETQK